MNTQPTPPNPPVEVTYKIHPGIGIARVGDSPDSFYLTPDTLGGLPRECDQITGVPTGEPVSSFKKDGKVRREAVPYEIFVYDSASPQGRPLAAGDTIYGPGSSGTLVDIEWTVHLANKKAIWYQFKELDGEHGYQATHPLRNPLVIDPDTRQKMIIDPGPRTVYNNQNPTRASLAKDADPNVTQSFPPPLVPNSIETLGNIFTNDLKLYVLGGFGNSGTESTEPHQPRIESFANNDGWYDDVSDGPVTARLVYLDIVDGQYRFVQVVPAWTIVAYPSYAPQIENLVTIDEVVYDLSVRYFAFNTYMYGTAPFTCGVKISPQDLPTWRQQRDLQWNPEYRPYFFRDVWPILQRPFNMAQVTSVLNQSFDPHEISFPRGNFYLPALSEPPQDGQDPYREKRMYLYNALRKPGQENEFEVKADRQLFYTDQPEVGGDSEHDPYSRLYDAPLMPLLCGDNPLSNSSPAKFFRLTDTQLFILRQWALGKFINEKNENIQDDTVQVESAALKMDRVALANALGGSFCPGGEVCWIIRNPAIYSEPYRINASRKFIPSLEASNVATTPGITIYEQPWLSLNNKIEDGMEPGDITKYSALPWQADFNECSDQTIDVTYEDFNLINPDDPTNASTYLTLWWPAHRPMEVQVPVPYGEYVPGKTVVEWLQWTRGISQNYEGDLKMVTAWKDQGFLRYQDVNGTQTALEQERAHPDIPAYIQPPPKPPKAPRST